MSNISQSCINTWVKMINEDKYTFNPDDHKADDNFIESDKYEQIARDIDEYYRSVEKTGKIEGNLNESDEECDSGETADGKADDRGKQKVEKADEAMTPEQIMKMFNEKNQKLAAEQAAVAKKVRRVDIKELYGGYVACEVTFANGDKKEMEFDVSKDELKDMYNQMEPLASKKGVVCDMDDAAVAVIRKRLDPTDTLDWFYKPTNTSLDNWFAAQEMENEEQFIPSKRHSDDWAEQMGLFTDEYGDDADDNFKSWDDGSPDSYFN